MRSELCVALLLVAAAVLVQSKTRIEIDENGDEYEVKRFTIEGRQLNSTQRQCVVTRRKRSTATATNGDTNKDQDSGKGNSVMLTAPTLASTLSAVDGDKNDDNGDSPVLAINGEDGEEPVVVASAPVDADATAGGGSTSNVASANGIVVVHTADKPPKVNPQTHAVFELLPVDANAYVEDEDNEEDEDDSEDSNGNSQFQYIYTKNGDDDGNGEEDDEVNFAEEISPVSTTAIWSTGVDDEDDYRDEPIRSPPKKQNSMKNKTPVKKKQNVSTAAIWSIGPHDLLDGDDYGDINQISSTTKKPMGKPTKKNKKRTKPQRQRPNKKAPAKKRRPSKKDTKKPAKRQQNKNKQTRPQSNKKTPPRIIRRQNRRPSSNKKKSNKLQDQKRKTPLDYDDDDDAEFYTRTVTSTETNGDPNDEKEVNCIIINKPLPTQPTTTTTTTPRPFWNILPVNLPVNLPAFAIPSFSLGRNSAGHSENKAFGNRRRVTMRFVAPSS